MEELRNIVAMVTPFVQQDEYDPASPPNIDWSQSRRLARHLIDSGADALAVAATTGSSATLSDGEKGALFHEVAEEVGREKVICGVGSNDTAHVINLTRQAQERGFRQFLVVTPYYNKTSQLGLYCHYAAVLGTLPDAEFILYCVAGRTGQVTEPDTIRRLAADCPNLIGIKDADGIEHAESVWSLVKDRRPDFRIWSGNDSDTFEIMRQGFGYGVISVDGHLLASERRAMIGALLAARSADFESEVEADLAAKQIHQRLQRLSELLMDPRAPNPAGIRFLVNRHVMPIGRDRLPQVDLPEDLQQALEGEYQEAKEAFATKATT